MSSISRFSCRASCTSRIDGRKVEAMDVHFHVVPPAFAEALRQGAFAEIVSVTRSAAGESMVFHAPADVPVEPETELEPRQYDERLLLAALQERRLDAAAISPPPELFLYWAPPEIAERIARRMNDGMADLARARPDRFMPLATLPLQDPVRAVRELERAVTELGLRGAALCTHINGRDLDQAETAPVFDAAARLDIPLFLHPQNSGAVE